MEYLTNIATSICVGISSSLIFTYANTTEKLKIFHPQTEVINPQSQNQTDYFLLSQSPSEYVKININISHSEDLKVKEGDFIEAGQVIAKNESARGIITRQIERINLLIEEIEDHQIKQPQLQFSQDIPPLPPHNFLPEEIAVDNARLQLDIAKGNYQAELNKELYLEETAAIEKAEAKVQQAQNAVQSQQEMIDVFSFKIDQDAFLEVEDVIIHETQVLQSKIAQLKQAQIDLDIQKAKLENAKQARKDRLINLVSQIEQSHSNLALARAKLEKAKADREYLENQHYLAKLRRIEEENQIINSYTQQQQRNKDIKLTQLRTQLAQREEQLAHLSVIKSPYSGRIKSIKVNKLQNKILNVEIVFIPNPGDEFFNPTNGERSITETSCRAGSRYPESNPITRS